MAKSGGFGVVLKIDVSGLTAVAYVQDVDYPEFIKYLVDATTHDSPGGYDEYISSGQRGLSEFTVALLWDISQATQAAMVTAFDADTAVSMSIEDPGGAEVIAFSAHMRMLKRMAKLKDALKAEVAIQPTGQPAIT